MEKYLVDIGNVAINLGFLPIPSYNKRPVVPGWNKYRKTHIDDILDKSIGKNPKRVRQISYLAKSGRSNNVSIITGEASDVVVFDIDNNEKNGFI